jgi:GTPase
MEAPTSST